ncbi:MAG TPA: beta family protein [Candidatus Angelobacter sp.]|jgi:hypothetical protein
MFDHRHYVPILKGRQGEYGALETLNFTVKGSLTPLIEIPPIPWNFTERQPAKSIDGHLAKVAATMRRSLGLGSSFFIDFLWISETERMEDGALPVEWIFRAAREQGLLPIPVLNLVKGTEILEATREIVQLDQLGVCLRIQREDFTEFTNLEEQMLTTLEQVSVSIANTDLILDLRSIIEPRQIDVDSVIRLVESIPRLRQWRSFTITATSFPENLAGLPPSDSSILERTEWNLWLDLLRRRRELSRRPTFGDYAISHPEPSEVDPRIMSASASIRYTADQSWLVLKGRSLRKNGFGQFFEVCRELVGRAEYSGSNFSWGDKYICDCADGMDGPGNLTTWRKVGTSHHLVFAVRQLANLSGS